MLCCHSAFQPPGVEDQVRSIVSVLELNLLDEASVLSTNPLVTSGCLANDACPWHRWNNWYLDPSSVSVRALQKPLIVRVR